MKHLVVTSINPPTSSVVRLAAGATEHGWRFIIIGDSKSPQGFSVAGAEFLDLNAQAQTGYTFANEAPTGHYARKNVGYLVAIGSGAEFIAETDDDNTPFDSFWADQSPQPAVPVVDTGGWTNVYSYFSSSLVWPRGLPLSAVRAPTLPIETLAVRTIDCPVQQGLADKNPDVDAIYRLLLPLPLYFERNQAVAIGAGASCPFNSQNTRWFPAVYPLLYLPFHCSFRMTDIWRSLVVERVLHANGWGVLFHGATVFQDRNEHDLMRDFADEVVGYLNNDRIRNRLLDVPLSGRPDSMLSDMEACYEALIGMELIASEERALIRAWRHDVEGIMSRQQGSCS